MADSMGKTQEPYLRGARSFLQGRFESVAREAFDDGWTPEERDERELETMVTEERARSILSTNDSPDVGFRFSLNPYRGCEHGCVYCLSADTPVLHADMSWRPLGEVQVGDVLFGFDEFPAPGRTRKFRPAVVQAVWWSRRPTLRLVTERTEVVTTAEHRWLQARSFRWSETRQLAAGR